MAAEDLHEDIEFIQRAIILDSLKQMFVGDPSAQIDLGKMGEELYRALSLYNERSMPIAAYNEHFASKCKEELLRVLPLFYQAALAAGSIEPIVKPTEWVRYIGDQELITAVLPFVENAFSQPNTTPDNFGRLACSYLNMDGSPETLIAPLKSLLAGPENDAKTLACQLCCEGFISFLNHPGLKESSELANLLRPFAGQIIPDQTDDTPSVRKNNTRILVSMQGNDVWVAWGQTLGGMYCRSIWNLECLSGRYSETASGVAPVIRSLLKKMGQDNLLKKAAENALLAIDLSQSSGREFV